MRLKYLLSPLATVASSWKFKECTHMTKATNCAGMCHLKVHVQSNILNYYNLFPGTIQGSGIDLQILTWFLNTYLLFIYLPDCDSLYLRPFLRCPCFLGLGKWQPRRASCGSKTIELSPQSKCLVHFSCLLVMGEDIFYFVLHSLHDPSFLTCF